MNINKKSDNAQNLMLGVYLSIKTNFLAGRNISLFTVFDLNTPLNDQNKCHSSQFAFFSPRTMGISLGS